MARFTANSTSVVGLVVLIAIAGCTTGPTSPTTTSTKVVGAGTAIQYSAADNAWQGPVTIHFEKQLPGGDWVTELSVTVQEGTRARVDLISDRTYRVTIENNGGQQQIAGWFTARQYRQNIHITPNNCWITIDNGDTGGE